MAWLCKGAHVLFLGFFLAREFVYVDLSCMPRETRAPFNARDMDALSPAVASLRTESRSISFWTMVLIRDERLMRGRVKMTEDV